MRIDLHCHSKYSLDTAFEPEKLIEQAIQMNLDGVCFTEHDSVEASEPVLKIPVPDDFYVFRGVEITTDKGHLLAYGLKDDSWNIWPAFHYPNAWAVIAKVHQLGGVCAPAHPFRVFESFGEAMWHINGFEAVETHNGRNSLDQNQRALETCQQLGLVSIGGSDCHHKHQVGRAFTLFNNPVRTLEALVEEIKKGACQGQMMEI